MCDCVAWELNGVDSATSFDDAARVWELGSKKAASFGNAVGDEGYVASFSFGAFFAFRVRGTS